MMKKILKNLGIWILVAMVAGAVVGVVIGEDAKMFAPLGTLFIQLIKMLVVPLVAISIISGAASLGGSRSAGVIGTVSIGYILVTTFVAVCLAFGADALFKPGVGVDMALFEGVILLWTAPPACPYDGSGSGARQRYRPDTRHRPAGPEALRG